MLANIVAVTAGFATTASAFTCTGNYFSFFNRGGDTLNYARLDPSLYPGTTSPHLHSFDGGSGLGAKTSFADLVGSECTTARVKQDKSLYWRPTLNFKNSTGFYRVPETNSKIYYKYMDGNKWANVTGFPEDFNMLAGSPTKRADGDNPAGVRWGCHQPDGRDDKIFANGFPTGFQSCKYGFASEVTFPSCWNGQKTDPQDPHAHMAYPTNGGGVGIENCPTTHRAARFPTIFIEFWYDISSFDKQYDSNTSPWVLSTGDTTGFGFHGDFMNGWEKGVLEKATGETGGCNCGCGCGQEEMETCFGSANVNKNDDPAFKSCGVTSANSDEAAKFVKTLPGCNPLTSGPVDAVPQTGGDCGAAPVAGGGDADVPAPSKSPAASYAVSSAVASSKAAVSSKAAESSVDKDDAKPSPISLPIKHDVDPTPAGSEAYGAPTPSSVKATPAASEHYGSGFSATKPTPSAGNPAIPADGDVPSLTLAPGKPTGTPAGEEDCKAPVYVTVTPTIYVTLGANNANVTSCGPATVTTTVKEVFTVTVSAAAGVGSGSY